MENEQFSPEEFERVLEKYRLALRGLYSDNMSDDQQIMEEVLADAHAGINAFGAGATKFTETVNEFLRENNVSREVSVENGTAVPTGPPSGQKENTAEYGGERFSLDDVSINPDLLELVDRVEQGQFVDNETVDLGEVNPEVATKIQQLIGIDVSGYKMAIEARQIDHILQDHGKNGATDHSMADNSDIAKMECVLQKPDDVRAPDRTSAYVSHINGRNRRSDTVLYDKKVGEKSYYVVQAVPRTKNKTLYIVTAFIGESGYKKGDLQSTNAKDPGATPEAESASHPSVKIAQRKPEVKAQIQTILDKVSSNHAEQMERYTELKAKDPDLAKRYYDGLMDGPYYRQFAEYLSLTEELEKLQEVAVNQNDGAIDEPEDVDYSKFTGEVDLRGEPKNMPRNAREWHAFNRSFANKTAGMRLGDTRALLINTADYVYRVSADGYMSGYVDEKVRITRKNISRLNDLWRYVYGINRNRETASAWIDAVQSRQRNNGEHLYASGNGDSAESNAGLYGESHGSDGTGFAEGTWPYTEGVDADDEVPGSLVYDGNGNIFRINEYGVRELLENDPRFSVDDEASTAAAKEELVEALRAMSPQEMMGDKVRELIDQYTAQKPVEPEKPKVEVDRGNLRKALTSTLGLTKEQSGKLSEVLDAYEDAVAPKRKRKELPKADVESKPTEAKKRLQTQIFDIFSIPKGQRAELITALREMSPQDMMGDKVRELIDLHEDAA